MRTCTDTASLDLATAVFYFKGPSCRHPTLVHSQRQYYCTTTGRLLCSVILLKDRLTVISQEIEAAIEEKNLVFAAQIHLRTGFDKVRKEMQRK